MVGRRTAVLIAITALLFVTLPASEAGVTFYKDVRVWEWDGPLPVTKSLQLAPSEEYDRYYFAITADHGGDIAVAHVVVEHAATGDTVCSGYTYDALSEKWQVCNDLRVGHGYLVHLKVPHPGTVILKAA